MYKCFISHIFVSLSLFLHFIFHRNVILMQYYPEAVRMMTTIFIIIIFQQSPATIRMIIITIIFILIIIMIVQQSPATTMVSLVLSLLLPSMALAAPGSQVEKAPCLRKSLGSWLLIPAWNEEFLKYATSNQEFPICVSLKSGIPEMCYHKLRNPEMWQLKSGIPEMCYLILAGTFREFSICGSTFQEFLN